MIPARARRHTVTLMGDLVDLVDAWRRLADLVPSRQSAVHELVAAGLKAKGATVWRCPRCGIRGVSNQPWPFNCLTCGRPAEHIA